MLIENTALIVRTQEGFELYQNYPNPFNTATNIKFTTTNVGGQHLQLIVYDVLGREIKTPINSQIEPGSYEVEFNANDLSSGIYFYKLTMGQFSETKKMILTK